MSYNYWIKAFLFLFAAVSIIAVIRYLRTDGIGWQNYSLSMYWILLGAFIVMISIAMPFLSFLIQDNEQMYNFSFQGELIEELLLNPESILELNVVFDQKSIDYVFHLGVLLILWSFLGLIIIVPFLVYLLFKIIDGFKPERSKYFRWGTLLLVGIMSIGILYLIIFGQIISTSFEFYISNGSVSRIDTLTFGQKCQNMLTLWPKSQVFIEALLSWNRTFLVLIEIGFTYFFIFTLLSPKFNLNYKRILQHEFD